ncbi:uncharacterized protein [Epargyreus clarus]|uniref:uncharacterized protein n=1 Tax=Epargyreus clarus TaxID=520877 RepID=UPI003C2CAD81
MNFDNVDMSSFPPYQVPPLTLVYPHMPTPDDIADVKDFSTVCRICTKVTFHVYPIFSGVGLEHDMAGVIEKYLQLKVSADDGLPGVVCVRCARALCGLAALRSTARLADAVLRRRLGLLPPKEPKPSQSVGTKSEDGNQSLNMNVEIKIESAESAEEHRLGETAGGAKSTEKPSAIVDENGKRYVWCETCKKNVGAASWRRHERAHRGERRYSCAACGLAFADGGNLARHARARHARARPHACPRCRRAFARRAHLRDHLAAHRDARDHVCDLCGKASKSAAALRMHRRTHDDVRRFRCVECGSEFKRNAELKAHVTVHTGEKAHLCGCGRAFRLRGQLTAHARTHVGGDGAVDGGLCCRYVDAATDPRPPCPQRVCSLCPLTVPTTRYNNHLVTKHVGTVFRCDECHCYLSDEDITFHLIEKGCTGVSMKRSAQKKCNSEESTKREEAEQKRRDAIDRIKLEEYKQKREKVVNEKVEDLRIRNLSSIPLLDFYKFLKFPDEVLKIPKRIGERIKIEGLNKYLPVEKSEPPDTEPPNKQKKIKNETPTKSNKKAIECSDNNDAQILAKNDNGRESHVEDGDENDNEGTDDSKPLKTSPKTKASEPIKKKEKVNEKSPKTSRTCPICGKEYRASSSYFYHMKYFHKRSREHECEVCGKKFGTKANLAQHASVHTGAYDLECKECGKRFRSKPSLYIHEQSHGGVKRWACGQCERSFRWRTHLARHVQRHAAQRAHVCGACGRGFSVRCDMLRHARTHAAAEFHCAACGLKFAQKRYLKVHMIKKHAEASAVVTRS